MAAYGEWCPTCGAEIVSVTRGIPSMGTCASGHVTDRRDCPRRKPETCMALADAQGMSLRDWFAGQALPQAVMDYGEPSCTSSAGQRRDRGNPILPWAAQATGTREEIIARQAYRYADAMLAAREAKP
jgi:hypothetical protein